MGSRKSIFIVFALLLFSIQAFAQKGWTKKQDSEFKQRIEEECKFSNNFCDCIYYGVTQTFTAKEVNYPENKEGLNAIFIECQRIHRAFPNQLAAPELQIANLIIKDKRLTEGAIRFDSEGEFILEVANRPSPQSNNNIELMGTQNDRIAYGCVLNISSSIKGLKITSKKIDINNILWGETKRIKIPYTTDTSLVDFQEQSITFTISTWNTNSKAILEANPRIQGYLPSDIQYKWGYEPVGNSWTLKLQPYNQGSGDAFDVHFDWEPISGLNLTNNKSNEQFASIRSGEQTNEIPISFGQKVDESLAEIVVSYRTRYSNTKTDTLRFEINKRLASTTKLTSGEDYLNQNLYSKVDDLPKVKKARVYQNAIALVIGIENYKSNEVSHVPYAKHDAEVVYQYMLNVIGIPKDNIFLLTNDPTRLEIVETLNKINEQKSIMIQSLDRSDIDVFFYYAGHGTGNNNSIPVLVPYDVSLNNIDAALRRDEDIMNSLASNTTGKVIGFIDACYASNSFNVGDRGLGVKTSGSISENVVVFSAVSENQKAFPNNPEAHGAFTYQLLSILKDNQGYINLGQMSTLLIEKVFYSTNKRQRPSVIYKTTDWKEWKLLSE